METRRPSNSPTVGIVTALPREFKAVVAMLEDPTVVEISDKGADQTYVLGVLPSKNGKHSVAALLLPDVGNNSSGIGAALLTANYPSIECVFMVGIAGGVPDPSDPSEHVRLGDVVVSGREGVVQYDFGKMLADRLIAKYPPRPPSSRMLQATRMLSVFDYQRDFHQLIDAGLAACGASRPPETADVLGRSADPSNPVVHPADPDRVPGRPRVFISAIASANQVLKNPIKREQLRNEHRAKAVEMEGSGIADLAWTKSIEYFVVRGICDYCDANKRDDWQDYASVVAAAYTRVLLSTVSSPGKQWTRRGSLKAVAVTMLMAAISAVALIQGNAPAKKTAQLYVEAVQPPVELRIDGVFIRNLTGDLPFTSVVLGEGNHRVVATFNGLRYEQFVQLKGGTSTIVRIPPMAR
jgi:nucleoside phosphorylase